MSSEPKSWCRSENTGWPAWNQKAQAKHGTRHLGAFGRWLFLGGGSRGLAASMWWAKRRGPVICRFHTNQSCEVSSLILGARNQESKTLRALHGARWSTSLNGACLHRAYLEDCALLHAHFAGLVQALSFKVWVARCLALITPVPRSIPCCLPLQTDIDMHTSGQVGVQYEQGISCDSKAEHGFWVTTHPQLDCEGTRRVL